MADPGQSNGGIAREKGEEVGPNPTDRAKLGTKRHIVSDRTGVPLSTVISAADKKDSLVHDEAWDSMIIIVAPDPQEVTHHAALDKGYDTVECRRYP